MATIEWLRPRFHYTATFGWINDPNGLCYFNGSYHLFYQHNPHGTHWEKMHWGHATSSDLLNWTDQPIALYPDQPYEDDIEGGCFSGSAIVHNDRLYLFYTAVQGRVQRQCLAYSDDGLFFRKYGANPIIESSVYVDFRDPKVFEHGGLFYLVIGAFHPKRKNGVVLLYCSKDLYNWHEGKVLFEVPANIGKMPECPDFFPINDKWVLTFSPMEFGPDGATVMAVIGMMDFSRSEFSPHKIQAFDEGGYYYALQTFLDRDGNRIGVGWCGTWPWMYYHKDPIETVGEGWNGYLSLPRILTIENDYLKSFPIQSGCAPVFTKIFSRQHIVLDNKRFFLNNYLKDVGHLHFKIDTSIRHSAPLEIGIYRDRACSAVILFDINNATLSFLEINNEGSIERNFILNLELEEQLILDIYLDRSSLEVFVNRGTLSMTINTYRLPGFYGPWLRSVRGNFTVELFTIDRVKDGYQIK